MYYWDKNGNIVSDTEQVPLSFIEKQQRNLQALGDNAKSWLNNSNPDSEAYKQKANLALGLITAPIGGSVALTNNIAKPLMPFFGKKIGQNVAQGIGSGLTGGAVEGFGRGLIENENPLKTMAQDSVIGGTLGGLGGYGLGKIAKNLEKQRILNSADNSAMLDNFFNDYVDGLSNKTKPLAEYRGLKQGVGGGNSNTLFDKNNPLHQAQLKIIENTNPAPDSYHTWIRNADDIYNFEDTLKEPNFDPDFIGDDFDPSYSWDMAQNAIKDGEIDVYSSYPIVTGNFVTPSEMEALSYSGTGKVYKKRVPLSDVAWIDPTQGQYAPPKLSGLYDKLTSEPLKYTGEYVKFKGKEYPEIFLPPEEYAPKFSDINTYIHQNGVENFKEKLKRYYPNYNLEVIIKNGTPRIINLER